MVTAGQWLITAYQILHPRGRMPSLNHLVTPQVVMEGDSGVSIDIQVHYSEDSKLLWIIVYFLVGAIIC